MRASFTAATLFWRLHIDAGGEHALELNCSLIYSHIQLYVGVCVCVWRRYNRNSTQYFHIHEMFHKRPEFRWGE